MVPPCFQIKLPTCEAGTREGASNPWIDRLWAGGKEEPGSSSANIIT